MRLDAQQERGMNLWKAVCTITDRGTMQKLNVKKTALSRFMR